jgi:hypothetical protein
MVFRYWNNSKTERAIRQQALDQISEIWNALEGTTKQNILVVMNTGEFREFHFGDGLERIS